MPYDHLINAVDNRTTGPLDSMTWGYVTEGGTYILASASEWNDENRPHDLLAVLPMPLNGSRLLVLRPNVNPDLVAALRKHLDPVTHRIVLDFENVNTLVNALDYIGDEDAPVEITDGAVLIQGVTHPLWDGFNKGMDHIMTILDGDG